MAVPRKRTLCRFFMAGATAVVAACGGGGGGADGSASGSADPRDLIHTMLSGAAEGDSAVIGLATGDSVRISPQTVAFYRGARFRPAWVEGDKAGDRAIGLRNVIAGATSEGLSPEDYELTRAQQRIVALDGDSLDDAAQERYAAELDVLLSEGYMRYATDIVHGSISPEDTKSTWRIPRREAPTEVVLRNASRGDPADILNRLRPTTPYYARMVAVLGRLQQVAAAGGWTPIPEGIAVNPGDSAQAVAILRARLAASEDAREAALAQAGSARPQVYDRDLFDAVRHFQTRHGQADDGRIGSATLRELNHTVEDRITEVKLNLDRWRWLPNDLGRLFVFVNIAGFELEVVENNRPIESMNVVVGKTSWKTPVFADTMESIVVNPYWNPPPSIIEEEILPAIARDPGYLERNNFERDSNGDIRQRPGPRNALGYYKFLFPNKDNIYLHDTPADNLFSRTRRDFSHGCIRLERPDDLAYLLAAKTNRLTPAEIDAMRATGREKWIQLKRKIPVYIVYFTAWADEDGTVRFHHDVYGHDEEMQQLERAAAQKVALARM